ncbi:hypothetical protein ABZ639_27050 [Saccharomonospora sp. NPDC006951]
MGLFGPRRDPKDPQQLRVAVHELGHAYAWKAAGLTVRRIEHHGTTGDCHVRFYNNPDSLRGFVIGCWAGLEAENLWAQKTGQKRASRGNSSYDLTQFRKVNRELGAGRLSESAARALARKHITRHYTAIMAAAPRLISQGRMSL